jgi:hypothetical protein
MRLMKSHRDMLLDFAKKYIWWETPEKALQRPYRVLAAAMNIGSIEDYQRIRQNFETDLLSDLLSNAEAG